MLLRDFAYASRTLQKAPVFALTAVVTLALGIGASTAIFSVTNAVLLRPLPYKNPDRLVLVCSDMTKRGVMDFPFSDADFLDLRNGARTNFEDFAAFNTGRTIWKMEDGTSEQVRIAAVTPNFFRLIGATITLGRDFSEGDGQPQQRSSPADRAQAGQAPQSLPTTAILSYEFWKRRYGGNMAILGHSMGNSGVRIVGVLAPGVELLFMPNLGVERSPDVWVAARPAYDNVRRNNVSLRVIGRLSERGILGQAQAEAEVVAAELRKNFSTKEASGFHIRLEPIHKYMVAEVRPAILALMGAVIFLLLIACANVANLLLVRTSLRERELAVRAALGGSRWHLIRQMLAESLLLAGMGALLGLGLTLLGIRALLVLAPENLPRLDAMAIDPIVLGFTALASLAATATFGLVPAWWASCPDVMQTLRGSNRTAGPSGGRRLRNTVVIAEVALSFVLLIGSGLMVRSFLALQRTDPGYDPHGLLTFLLSGAQDFEPQRRAMAIRIRELQERLRVLHGVQSVTAFAFLPLADGFRPIRWGTEQALVDPSKFQAADYQLVLPGYFETLRTPLVAGRMFSEEDNAPERNVAIVDEFLAAKAFPKESAVGKRILIRIRTPEPEWIEVIGVVGHQHATSLAELGREQIYFTDGFLGHGAVGRWAIRVAGDPAKQAGAVRAEIARFAPHSVITEMQPMEAVVERSQAGTRFSLLLIGVFATIAAVLASVGLYGVLSTVVRQRTAEIGVRMAFGASPASIFNLVVRNGVILSATGIAIGLVTALALTRVMSTMLVGVKATDPATFVTVAVLFLLIAALASWLPARRAAGLDPTTALREE